jgi:hypothetical protein
MTCLGLLVLALTARPALADNCTAPPGTSGIDQYCETLPSPGGSSHQGPNGGSGHKSGGSNLPSATRKALSNQGAAGAGVLALTKQSDVQVPSSQGGSQASSSPAGHSKKTKHSSSTTHRSTQDQTTSKATPASIPAAPASNPVSAVGKSLSGDGGLLLALVIAAGLLGLLGWAARRGRSGPESA